ELEPRWAESGAARVSGRSGQGQHRIVEQGRGRIRRTVGEDDVLAGPDIGKPELFRLFRSAADRLRPRLAPDLRQMNAEPHGLPPARLRLTGQYKAGWQRQSAALHAYFTKPEAAGERRCGRCGATS